MSEQPNASDDAGRERRVAAPSASRSAPRLALSAAVRIYPRRFREELGVDLLRMCQQVAATPGGDRGLAWNVARGGVGARLDDLRRWLRRSLRRAALSGAQPGSPSPPERKAPMDGFSQDLRYAFRTLLATPGFSLVAVLSLALGIGSNASIFGAVDAALWRTLPVERPEELAVLHWASFNEMTPDISHNGWRLSDEAGRGVTSSWANVDFLAIREAETPLHDVFAFADLGRVNVIDRGNAELAQGQIVSGNYFEVLGVRPVLGRLLGEADDSPVAPPAVVLGHAYWQRRFGGDPDVLGRTVSINNHALTIVGVTAPEFQGTLQVGSVPDLTVPLAQQPPLMRGRDHLADGRYWWLHIMGRVSADATHQQVQAGLQPFLDAALEREAGEDPVAGELLVVSGARGMTEMRSQIVEPLTILATIAGIVLLIACANVANLLLARSGARRREIAVRVSLGATRSRIIAQLLTESLVLSTLGALAGIGFAYGTRGLLLGAVDSLRRVNLDLGIDVRVLGFTMLASLVTALLFGLVPAMRSSRVDLAPSLRGARLRPGERASGLGVPKTFLVAQVALSLVLLVGTGLLTRTLINLRAEVAGFNAENVLLFDLDPALSNRESGEIEALYDEVLRRVRALSGVQSASFGRHTPVSGHMSISSAYLQEVAEGQESSGAVFINVIEPVFFETFRIPLLLGRALGADDVDGAPRVAVVNEAFVQEHFAGENPIGRRFGFGNEGNSGNIEIVGVVGNVKYQRPRDDMWPAVHLPVAQNAQRLGSMTLAVRTDTDPLGAVSRVREVVRELAADVPMYNITTQQAQSADILVQERQIALLSASLSGLAVALACIGLYGILSYNVIRRTREIGIRMALGAGRIDVARLLLAEARAVGLGVVVGLSASYFAIRLVENSLYGLAATDPLNIVFATGLLVAVSVAAACLPARRAARIDPVVALRSE